MPDDRNVIDKYKEWELDLIKEDLQNASFPYAVLMTQIQGDFNFGSVVRSANFLGAKEVFYFGKKHWDKRSSVGTHHYTNVKHIFSLEDLLKLKELYSFVALENNINRNPVKLSSFEWKKNSLIIIGEESVGLPNEILDICDSIVEISGFGSVRSLNAAVAGSVAMYDYVSKYQ